jgi:N-formylglutamate amidohydrolase
MAVRRGIGVVQFATGRDNNTDELAAKTASKLEERFGVKPFLIVALFERKYLDVNRPPSGAYESHQAKPYYDSYHRALRTACDHVRRKWGRGLLLDIHGQGSHGDTIYRGTHNGRTVMSLIDRFGRAALSGAAGMFGHLAQIGYRVFPPDDKLHEEERYTGGYIIRTYGSHQINGIDAIQLEIGTDLRRRGVLDRTAADLAQAIAVFAQEYLPSVKSSAPMETANQPLRFALRPLCTRNQGLQQRCKLLE